MMMRRLATAVIAGLAIMGMVSVDGQPAAAGSHDGNFMVRVQGTYVNFNDDSSDLAGIGGDLELDDEFIPTATLTYFFNKNVALELFCCFAKLDADHSLLGNVADFWVFPPALTLQYHFDSMGAIKPYVGAGIQYILPFSEEAKGLLAGNDIEVDDALGFTLQAGVDVALGEGWYLNADVKKTWIEHTVSLNGAEIYDVGIDPWIFSVGLGYRFNLEDLFGRRAAVDPMK